MKRKTCKVTAANSKQAIYRALIQQFVSRLSPDDRALFVTAIVQRNFKGRKILQLHLRKFLENCNAVREHIHSIPY